MSVNVSVAHWISAVLLGFLVATRAATRTELATLAVISEAPEAPVTATHVISGAPANANNTRAKTKCQNNEYDVYWLSDDIETKRMVVTGMMEWMSKMRDGSWGPWLKQRISSLKKIAKGCGELDNSPEFSEAFFDAMLDDEEDEEASRKKASSEVVYDAWHMFKRQMLLWVPEAWANFSQMSMSNLSSPSSVLGVEIDYTYVPVAAFSNNIMQSVGLLKFDTSGQKLHIANTVTRHAMSKDVEATPGTTKGAARVILADGLQNRASSQINAAAETITLVTFPFSAFVRQYYIENGAKSACGADGEYTDADCETMAKRNPKENCDCDVEVCLRAECAPSFAYEFCGQAGIVSRFSGLTQRCYNFKGDFVGFCIAN